MGEKQKILIFLGGMYGGTSTLSDDQANLDNKLYKYPIEMVVKFLEFSDIITNSRQKNYVHVSINNKENVKCFKFYIILAWVNIFVNIFVMKESRKHNNRDPISLLPCLSLTFQTNFQKLI